ncbi:MAG: two-component regulator propeller domain-containing protein [Bacteroidota bacterium]
MHLPFKITNTLLVLSSILILLFSSTCQKLEPQRTPQDKTKAIELHAFPGLPQLQKEADQQVANYVVELSEDSKGHLWFGSVEKGVGYFDGKTLRYFSVADGLVDNTVASIEEDREGHLWFGTHHGASRYDGKEFQSYTETEGLHGMGGQILQDKNGTIWAGTNHGLFRFDGQQFLEFELPKPLLQDLSYKWELGKIWDIMEDSKGQLWFARDGYGACRFDGQSFKHFTKANGLCSNNVSSIVEDAQGNIWFGTLSSDFPQYINEGGVSRFDGQQMDVFPTMAGLHNNDIYLPN